MSTALQVALFAASVAVVVFVAFLIPVFIGLRKCAARATRELEELKSEVKLLVHDSRSTLLNVNNLTSRAHRQLDEVDKVVRSAREWSERAGRIVAQVGDVVEAPIFTGARVVSIVYKGLSRIFDVLTKKEPQPTLKESESPAPDSSVPEAGD
jgi:uncharacterized protein YoxC